VDEPREPPVDVVLDVQDVCMGVASEIETEEEDGGEVLS
jgi:hypothetical protein